MDSLFDPERLFGIRPLDRDELQETLTAAAHHAGLKITANEFVEKATALAVRLHEVEIAKTMEPWDDYPARVSPHSDVEEVKGWWHVRPIKLPEYIPRWWRRAKYD